MFSFQRALSKTLICSLAALASLLFSAGTCLAQGKTVAPVLVPYQITAIAGNSQSSIPGYGGDGVIATTATLNGPSALAVDSVGNVYFADQSNGLIREINAQTGIIENVTGVPPTSCTGTLCTSTHPGCSDGVPAVGAPAGSRIDGMAVDGFGNLYFVDYNYQSAWIIFHGGARVANFIALVDPTAVASTKGQPVPGYVYRVAGNAVPKAGGSCTSSTGSTDKVLATSAVFHDPLSMGLDAAGNIYIQDYANQVVRVVNTQPTAQTFFGVTVQPGYVAAVVGCSAALSQPCPTSNQFGVPATQALYSSVPSGMTVDAYGNVYELDGKGANGGIYGGVAYAGGSALGHLINVVSTGAGTPLTATPGDWYEVINSVTSTYGLPSAVQAVYSYGSNNIVLRPVSEVVDNAGNIYMLDYHWIAIYRIDVNTGMATRINAVSGVQAGTNAAPVPCATGSAFMSYDAYGDGCPVQLAKFNSGGTGYVAFDAAGNLYMSDIGNNIIRKVSLGNQFAATNVGTAVSHTIQLHFDPSNLPSVSGTTPFSTNAFKIGAGSADFSVASSNCSNYTLGLDTSLECYATISFNPSSTGVRTGSLLVTTANGSNYSFTLSGFGNGSKIAIDGGSASVVPATGLGKVAAVATDAAGNLYIADATNNRVLVTPAAGGTQTTIGSGLSNPMGVAVDAAGNVYISDTGNNRVVEVAAIGGAQSVLTTNVVKPQGLTVDNNGNVYVADTGNARVIQIAPSNELGTVSLLAYSGAQALVSPVGVAVDRLGNIYVADSGNSNGLVKILAGGGDLQVVAGTTGLNPPASLISFGTAAVSAPSGVAIDAAGDLYVSDATGNTVQVLSGSSGPGSEPYTLNFIGLNGPTGIALDPYGNVYVADSGNSRVLVDNRTSISVNFGVQAQFQPAANIPLTVTNIGTAPLAPATPFAVLSGATADFSEKDTCAPASFSTGVLTSGIHCSSTVSFLPVVNGPLSASASVQNGAANISLQGTGENPLVKISLAVTSPATGPVYGSPAAITLTATQPNGGLVPSGTVTFNYSINGVAQPAITQSLSPNGAGGATTILNLNNLLAARIYVINATYNGDAADSVTQANPLTFTVPGLPITVMSSSVSYTYGQPVPAITGTVTGILPADQAAISVNFVTAATSTSPVGVYPISVQLTGGNSANYTIPNAITATGGPATVTENQAPLSLVVPSFTVPYGQKPGLTYSTGQVTTGAVAGDTIKYNYTPADSSVLPVGTYSIVPTLTISPGTAYDRINNYKLSITNGTLTVTQGASQLNVSQTNTAILPTALSSGTISISAVPPITTYYGTPTGKVVMTDAFTPITAAGTGSTVNNPTITLTLVNGSASYTPTDPTLGTHVYTFSYSGDSNFLATSTSATPTSLIVDNADFTVVSTSSPIQIAPGIVPGGVATAPGEQAATPEIATVYIVPILGSTETVNLTCAVPASYITCTLTPSSIVLTGKTTLTSVVSVSVPATLPINFTSQLERPGQLTGRRVAFAAIPLAFLTLLPLCFRRRRIRISRLMVLLASVALLAGASGCGSNNVKFFTPVPAGPSSVVITGTSGSFTRSFTVPLNIQ